MVNSHHVRGVTPTVAVIINVFKRIDSLERQIEAILQQSVTPTEVWIWQNKWGKIPQHIKDQVKIIDCSENLGVWARFAFALTLPTDFVCVFDDDTIPGNRWLENCLQTYQTHPGLLGTRGVRFRTNKRYYPLDAVGWDAPNATVERVDIVGHSWFFPRSYLAAFWQELANMHQNYRAGEDIHFSYALQKHLGINTYVPPHPLDDHSLWGSLPESAMELGQGSEAISQANDAYDKFDSALVHYVKQGFKLCYQTQDTDTKAALVIGGGLRKQRWLIEFIERHHHLKALVKKIVRRLERYNVHL